MAQSKGWSVFAALILVSSCSWGSGTLLLIDAAPTASKLAAGIGLHAWPSATNVGTSALHVWPVFDDYSRSGFFVSTDEALGWNLSSVQRPARRWGRA